MMIVLLIAGIGSVLAGLLAIAFGIPVKEFSFGNTLILVGAVAVCTGMILLGLGMVVRELKNIARRLGSGAPAQPRARVTLPPIVPGAAQERSVAEDDGFLVSRDQPADTGGPEPAAGPPWREEGTSRTRGDAPPMPEPAEPAGAPAPKPRRNLLFASTSRKERERAQARAADPSAPEAGPAPLPAPPDPEPGEPQPASFDDAWPKSERQRGADAPPRRGGRAPSTFADANPPAEPSEDQPVTVLKSGVVDGMAYSLYSDGSIEAQMPEGMMRFASIEELRAHLEHRP